MTDCKAYCNKESIKKRGVIWDRGLWMQMVISTRYIPRNIGSCFKMIDVIGDAVF